jgi:hypothetical protein
MATKSVAKVLNSTNQTFVTSVSETQGILSTPNKSDTSWGNLGDLNAPSVSSYEAVDLLGSKVTQLSTFDTYMQTIDVVAGSSLQNALVAELDSKSKEDKGLQMYSFQLKPALVADRIAALGDAPVGSDSGEETPGESGKSGSCKPAIYLYPTKTEDVIVKLNLKGDLTYTKPSYPEDGWKVSANPDGKLLYNSEPLDYLYYEMKVNDSDLASVRNNNEGYVVDYSTLGSFFERVLPQLGLNSKETTEYKAYWLKALPKSPYYRVSLVPSSLLDKYAGLNIQPTPDSVLRVTLDFQPLDQKITLKEPHLPSFKRSGFTVVEWAGTFKADKNHPFTCLL